jgi:hypothetical protein
MRFGNSAEVYMASRPLNLIILRNEVEHTWTYVRRASALKKRAEEVGEVGIGSPPSRLWYAHLRLWGSSRVVVPLYVGRTHAGRPAIHGLSFPIPTAGDNPIALLAGLLRFVGKLVSEAQQAGIPLERAFRLFLRTLVPKEGTSVEVFSLFLSETDPIWGVIESNAVSAPPPTLQEATPLRHLVAGSSGAREPKQILMEKLAGVLQAPDYGDVDEDEGEDEEEMVSRREEPALSPPAPVAEHDEEEATSQEASVKDEEKEEEAKASEVVAEGEVLDADAPAEPLPFFDDLARHAKRVRKPPVLPLPHPAIWLAHAGSVVAAWLTAFWPVLYAPLGIRHPVLLLLIPHGLLVRAAMALTLSGAGQATTVVALIWVALIASFFAVVSTAYRAAGYELDPLKGLMAVLRVIASAIAAVQRPRGQQQAQGGAGASAGSFQIGGGGGGAGRQASDVLVVLAAVAHHIPFLSFLSPVLLGAALSVEAKGAPSLSVLLAASLIARHLASSTLHAVAAALLAVASPPGIWMIPHEELGKAWAEMRARLMEALADLRQGRLFRFGRASEGARSIRVRLVPVRADPEILELVREVEASLGLRAALQRYVLALEAASENPEAPADSRRIWMEAARAVREILESGQPLIIPSAQNCVYTSLIRFYPQPALAEFRPEDVPEVQDGDDGGEREVRGIPFRRPGRRYGFDDDDGEKGKGPTLAEMLKEPKVIAPAVSGALERMRKRQIVIPGATWDEKAMGLRVGRMRPLGAEQQKELTRRAGEELRHRVFGREVFVPFAYSAMRGASAGYMPFGLMASPRRSAHMVIAAPTRSGKSVAMAGMLMRLALADLDPKLPFRLSSFFIDGKGETASMLAPMARHMLLPPMSFDATNPWPILWAYSAAAAAVVARNAFAAEIQRAAEILRQEGEEVPALIQQALQDPTVFGRIAAILPEAAAWLLVKIDEFWGIQDAMGQLRAIKVEIPGQDKPVQVSAVEILNACLNRVILMGASAGVSVIVATQSPRKEAFSLSSMRDNCNVMLGPSVPQQLVVSLLSDEMKQAMATIRTIYVSGSGGQGSLPTYTWLLLPRSTAYGALDGDRLITSGDERGGEKYGGDLIYPPYTPPEALARLPEPRPYRVSQESLEALLRLARGVAGREGFPMLSRLASAPDPARELREMLAEMLSWPWEGDPNATQRTLSIGQKAIADIAAVLHAQIQA